MNTVPTETKEASASRLWYDWAYAKVTYANTSHIREVVDFEDRHTTRQGNTPASKDRSDLAEFHERC
jgi:hypothetical protein